MPELYTFPLYASSLDLLSSLFCCPIRQYKMAVFRVLHHPSSRSREDDQLTVQAPSRARESYQPRRRRRNMTSDRRNRNLPGHAHRRATIIALSQPPPLLVYIRHYAATNKRDLIRILSCLHFSCLLPPRVPTPSSRVYIDDPAGRDTWHLNVGPGNEGFREEEDSKERWTVNVKLNSSDHRGNLPRQDRRK